MGRISQEKRDDIIKIESNLKFTDKINAARTEFQNLLREKALKSVPDWITDDMKSSQYIHMSCSVSMNYGEHHEKYYSTRKNRSLLPVSLPSAVPSKGHCHNLNFCSKIKSKADKILKINEEKEEFQKKLRSILYSFTTDTKLLENVPELKKYFNNGAKVYAVVPIEQIKEIRTLLT